MDLGLEGKAVIVTGGSRGIGKAVARELAREGADVVICARHSGALEDTARELMLESGRRIIPVLADTRNRESVEHLVEAAIESLNRVDILVNNAAFPGGLVQGPLADASEESLQEDINTKVVGYFRCAKAVAPCMRKQGSGRIINIGGLSARQSGLISGLRNAAIVHLTKTLSDQLGSYGITVNLVHPGSTRTERTEADFIEQARLEGVGAKDIEGRITEVIAIRRIVEAKEIGYLVAFLASEKASAITGEVIAASGGCGNAVFQ